MAQTGDNFAQGIIAEMYENGYGVPVDKESAFEYYMKSANGGCCEAMNNLGTCYADGKGGLEKDEYEAVKWYRKAAEQGHENARKILSESYGINTKEE